MIIIEAGYSSLPKTAETRKAPSFILKAFDDVFFNESHVSLSSISRIKLMLETDNMENSFLSIEKAVESAESRPVIIGGDHSITYPAFKGFSKNFENPALLVFDAHPDLMDDFHTHEDYLYKLIQEGFLKKENLLIVGVRNLHMHELNTINSLKIKVFWMKQCFTLGMEELANLIMEKVRFNALYLSVDIDAIDPAFAPGTNYPEPGGFTSREFLYLIERIAKLKNLMAMDIVEVDPSKDINGITSKLAAKIVGEFQQKI